MVSKRIKKSEQLPKYGTNTRSLLVLLTTATDAYKKSIEKGYPLFTEEELKEIKARYETRQEEGRPVLPVGLTWEDIQQELEKKKVFLKKVTFRKYIQDGYLPDAIGYRSINKARVAVFPLDTISHINLIQYFYKVADSETIAKLLEFASKLDSDKVSYLDVVESRCRWHNNPRASIYHYLAFDDDEARAAIEETLVNRKEDQQKALGMLYEIDNKFKKYVETEIDKLIGFLETHYMTVEDLPEDKEDIKESSEDKKNLEPLGDLGEFFSAPIKSEEGE